MTDTTTNVVHTSVDVEAPLARVFTAFTEEMALWWPPDHHILQSELATMEVEPRVGGGIVDRAADGTECRWARVLVWEPPHRFVFTWDISLQWQVEPDPTRCSEVDVRFTEVVPGTTRVDLAHSRIERHGEGWEQMHSAVGGPEGWDVGMRRFVDYVEGHA
jgi:uncharacterized protein YndB with AHSA1/START domain